MHAEAADHVQVPLQVGRKRLQGDVDGAGLCADVSQPRGGGDEDAVSQPAVDRHVRNHAPQGVEVGALSLLAHQTPQHQLGVLPIPDGILPRLGGLRHHSLRARSAGGTPAIRFALRQSARPLPYASRLQALFTAVAGRPGHAVRRNS